MLNYDTFFIGGKWVDAAGTDTVDVVSPTTGEVIGSVRDATPADMDAAVAAARAAFDNGPWPQMSPNERADIMATISAEITAQFDDFATLISTEMGAPLSFAQMGHVFAATAVLDTYTQLARDFAFEEVRAGMLGPTVVRREPVGVAAAIIPWNVPLFITMLKLAPALASSTPLDALLQRSLRVLGRRHTLIVITPSVGEDAPRWIAEVVRAQGQGLASSVIAVTTPDDETAAAETLRLLGRLDIPYQLMRTDIRLRAALTYRRTRKVIRSTPTGGAFTVEVEEEVG